MTKYYLTHDEVDEGNFSGALQFNTPEEALNEAEDGQNLIQVTLVGRYTQEHNPVKFNPVNPPKKRRVRKK